MRSVDSISKAFPKLNRSQIRELTASEINAVYGGDGYGSDDGGVVVVGGGSGGTTYPGSSGDPYSGGSGGGGTTGTPSGNGYNFTTPAGNHFHTAVNLSASQAQSAAAIVDFGVMHNFAPYQIQIAVNDAWYESSLKYDARNGTHVGLYQYNSSTWAANHETGNIDNRDSQIAAIYHDISMYEDRYYQAMASNANGIANNGGLTFGQYFEIKHELGNNSTDWHAINPANGKEYISDWADKGASFGFGQ